MEARRRKKKKKSKDVPAVTSSKSLLAALAFGQIRCCAKLCTSFGFIVLLWILLRAHVGKSYVAAHFTLKVDGHATESISGPAALPTSWGLVGASSASTTDFPAERSCQTSPSS